MQAVKYHHLLLWLAVVYALIAPRLDQGLVGLDRKARFCADRLWLLPRLITLLPVALLLAHSFESATVHSLDSGNIWLAPVLLFLACMIARNLPIDKWTHAWMTSIDFLVLLGMLLAYLGSYVSPRMSGLMDTAVVFPIAAGAAFVVYAAAFARLRSRKVLTHAAVVVGLCLAFLLVRVSAGSIYLILSRVRDLITHGANWMEDNPWLIFLALGLGLAAFAVRNRSYTSIVTAVLYAIVWCFAMIPGGFLKVLPEALQTMALAWILIEALKETRLKVSDHAVLALVFLGGGVARLYMNPTWPFALAIFAEIAALLIAGRLLRDKAYWGVGLFGLVAALLAAGVWLVKKTSLATIVIAAGLLFFAGAVLVSVKKAALGKWLNPGPDPEPGPDEAQITKEELSDWLKQIVKERAEEIEGEEQNKGGNPKD
jgi:hypothetical protein